MTSGLILGLHAAIVAVTGEEPRVYGTVVDPSWDLLEAACADHNVRVSPREMLTCDAGFGRLPPR